MTMSLYYDPGDAGEGRGHARASRQVERRDLAELAADHARGDHARYTHPECPTCRSAKLTTRSANAMQTVVPGRRYGPHGAASSPSAPTSTATAADRYAAGAPLRAAHGRGEHRGGLVDGCDTCLSALSALRQPTRMREGMEQIRLF